MAVANPSKPRCRAHNQQGARCSKSSIPGGTVCRWHGGRAPQVLASAEQRMKDLVHPAIDSLARQINKDEFPATRYVLDWAGFRPSDDDSTGDAGPVHVTVIFDRNADQDTEKTTLSLNGHSS